MAKFVTRARRDSGQASIIVNFDAFTHVVPGASAIVLCILRTGFGRYVVLPPSSCAAPPISFRGERKPRIGCDLIRVRAIGWVITQSPVLTESAWLFAFLH